MAKQSTSLELTDFSAKWGLVTVTNPDGSLNRQYVITAAEAEAVHTGNNVLPPRCTTEEWSSGRVSVSSQPFDVGQAISNEDGTLLVNYGTRVTDRTVTINFMKLEPTEWAMSGDTLLIDAVVAPTIDVAQQEVTALRIVK